MLELSIAIGVVGAFLGLAVDVAAVPQPFQQLRDARGTHLVAHTAQRRRQIGMALRHPAQGRIGSPIVAGSNNWRRSSSNVGSQAVSGGRPAPGRRILPARPVEPFRSFRPRPIVLRATLVARAAASAAACRRRPFSLNESQTAWYRLRMGFSSIMDPRYLLSSRFRIAANLARQPIRQFFRVA